MTRPRARPPSPPSSHSGKPSCSRVGPQEQARYSQVTRTHLIPKFRDALDTIDRPWIRRFLANLQATTNPTTGQPQYAPGTVHKVLTTLSSIMSEAVEAQMIDANPWRDVRRKLLRKEVRHLIPLTPSEVAALAAQIARAEPYGLPQRPPPTQVYVPANYPAAQRDVDLLKGELRVRQALKILAGRHTGLRPDEERGGAHSGPGPRARRSTRPAHPPRRPSRRSGLHRDSRHRPDSSVAFLRNHFKPACRAALPDHPTLRWHDLRHTFVSLLIAQGVNVKAIAAQAGHSSAAFTLDVYGHLMPGSDDELRQALSAAWSQATPKDANVLFAPDRGRRVESQPTASAALNPKDNFRLAHDAPRVLGGFDDATEANSHRATRMSRIARPSSVLCLKDEAARGHPCLNA